MNEDSLAPLMERPHAFSLFAALRLIERACAEQPRLGESRIDGLNVLTRARTTDTHARTTTVTRAEYAASSSPATSGPTGCASSAMLRATLLTRPTRWSGVTAVR